MNNKQQTAVEWFLHELITFYIPEDLEEYGMFMKIVEQAKEMEKEQMKIAFEIYRDLLSHYEDGSAFEDYYKQTYGGNK